MSIDTLPEKPSSSPAACLVRALDYLRQEAEEIGLTETAFLIGIARQSIGDTSTND